MRQNIPKYYYTRIYLIAILVYLMLLIPVNIFLMLKSLPEFAESDQKVMKFLKLQFGERDSWFLSGNPRENPAVDTLTTQDTTSHESAQDGETLLRKKRNGRIAGNNSIFFPFLLLALIFLIIYNRPFRKYFRKKRKGRPIPDNLQRYCEKHLLQTPYVNTGLLFLPFLMELLHNFYMMAQDIGPYGMPVLEDVLNPF